MKKRAAALFLSLWLVFGLLPAASAEGETVVQSKSVQITDVLFTMDTASGATDVTIYYNNRSGKVMKYIRFYATPYNAVGDPVNCTMSGNSQVELLVTGPIQPRTSNDNAKIYILNNKRTIRKDANGQYYFIYYRSPTTILEWFFKGSYISEKFYMSEDEVYEYTFVNTETLEDVWFNTTITSVKIDKIEIVYMDGTEETIENPLD